MIEKKAMQDEINFDKFMDEIIQKEAKRARAEQEEKLPAREYLKRYAEHPHNRTRVK